MATVTTAPVLRRTHRKRRPHERNSTRSRAEHRIRGGQLRTNGLIPFFPPGQKAPGSTKRKPRQCPRMRRTAGFSAFSATVLQRPRGNTDPLPPTSPAFPAPRTLPLASAEGLAVVEFFPALAGGGPHRDVAPSLPSSMIRSCEPVLTPFFYIYRDKSKRWTFELPILLWNPIYLYSIHS